MKTKYKVWLSVAGVGLLLFIIGIIGFDFVKEPLIALGVITGLGSFGANRWTGIGRTYQEAHEHAERQRSESMMTFILFGPLGFFLIFLGFSIPKSHSSSVDKKQTAVAEMIQELDGHKLLMDKVVFQAKPYAHTKFVITVIYSPDGKILASGGDDKTIKLWSIPDGKLLTSIPGYINDNNLMPIAFSRDSKTLASADDKNSIVLRSVPAGKLLTTLDGHKKNIRALAYSPDGTMLASGSHDRTIILWSIPEGKLLATLNGHRDNVNAITFSPDGQWLATGSGDKTIKLWSIPEGKLLTTLNGHENDVMTVAFSPNGKLLASGGYTVDTWERTAKKGSEGKTPAFGDLSNSIMIWSMPEGHLITTLPCDFHVFSVAFSPDGKVLASGGQEIKLWTMPDGKQSTNIYHLGESYLPARSECIAFSPDGRMLAGIEVEYIYLWEMDGDRRCWMLYDPLVVKSSVLW